MHLNGERAPPTIFQNKSGRGRPRPRICGVILRTDEDVVNTPLRD